MNNPKYDDLMSDSFSHLYGFRRNVESLDTEGGDPMSSSVSDDITVEITCMSCGKKFVINTAQLGAMTICPHCNTVMIAQMDDDADTAPED
jgi:DNA-directed RNA polymerase subunit RPC12/RpoP